MPGHIDRDGGVHMIDVGDKAATRREATASATVRITPEQVNALTGTRLPKGDWRTTAQIAGIQGAKSAGTWIPLCHPLPLEHVDVTVDLLDRDARIRITCTVCATAKTGVEMEALAGAAAAALAVYDMIKGVDKGAEVERLCLERKSGGRSGTWRRDNASD